MASSINTTNLDALYPVAGVDNDSQGFRDNFANIKTNLETAATEITDLQAGVARIDDDNDFNGNVIEDATLKATTPLLSSTFSVGVPVNPIDPAQTAIDVSFNDGLVHDIDILGDSYSVLSIAPIDFPASRYGEMRLVLFNASSTTGVQVTIDGGNGTVYTDENAGWNSNIWTVDANERVVIDVFSFSQGNTIYAKYVGTFS